MHAHDGGLEKQVGLFKTIEGVSDPQEHVEAAKKLASLFFNHDSVDDPSAAEAVDRS